MSHKNIILYYVWSSNKYTKSKFNTLAYKNYLDVIFAFVKYQVRAWDIFKKYPGPQTNIALEVYLDMYKLFIELYYSDKLGIGFINKIEDYAKICRKEEMLFLTEFGRSKESIKRIMKNFY